MEKAKWCLGLNLTYILGLAGTLPTDVGKTAGSGKVTRVKAVTLNGQSSHRVVSADILSEELEFDFLVDGEAPVRSRSKRVSNLRPMATFDGEGGSNTRDWKNQQLYIGEGGSVHVLTTTGPEGTMDTKMKATYKNGHGEKCFLARGESHCWRVDGQGTVNIPPWEAAEVPASRVPKTSGGRERRDRVPLVYTDFNATRVLKVVYVVDKAFMDCRDITLNKDLCESVVCKARVESPATYWFIGLSGDEKTGIEDAEDYVYMLNNEVNYIYRSIKDISEAEDSIPDMDIVTYVQGFYYPRLGRDWTWLRRWVSDDGIDLRRGDGSDGALSTFGQWVGEGNLDRSGPFDTAHFISQRQLFFRGNQILGISYVNSVCNPELPENKVSVSWDGYFEIARTLSHELAHSFNVRHDGTEENDECPPDSNIMSPTPFYITEETKDIYNTFSVCSVRTFVQHVNKFPGCLLDGDISNEAFYDQLCRGVRGSNQFDINNQCKVATRLETSVVCSPDETVSSGKISADACRDEFPVLCTNSTGGCGDNFIRVFDGTPCNGSEPSKDYMCYLGTCLERMDVCAGRTDPSPTPSCSCQTRGRRLRCCRNTWNPDGSCCIGCQRSRFGTSCVVDWFR